MSDLPLDYSKPVYVSGNIWACFFTDWNRSECKVQRCFLWGEGQEAGEVCEAEGESALSFLFTYVTIKKDIVEFQSLLPNGKIWENSKQPSHAIL